MGGGKLVSLGDESRERKVRNKKKRMDGVNERVQTRDMMVCRRKGVV